MRAPLRPEADAALLERCAVTDPAERGHLIGALAQHGEVLALYPSGAADTFVVSRLLGWDAASGRLEMEFAADPAREAAFERAGRATAVAVLARVKLQFALACLRVDALRRRLSADAVAPFARLQRRDAFRVVPPLDAQVRLVVNDGIAERRVVVLDVSATGIAFRFDAPPSPLTEVGRGFAACRLELPASPPIRCDLIVRSVDPMAESDRSPQVRLGCEFAGLDSSAARTVQMYVNAAQARARRVRPRLN